MQYKNRLKILLAFFATAFFAASCIQQAQRSAVTVTSAETPLPMPERVSKKTFEDFSHSIKEHKQFECLSCHEREGRSLKMEYAGHDSCIGCHLNQFIDKQQVMCDICHKSVQVEDPTMKAFPVTFREGFNMKFDHGDHDNGRGRPAEGCSACHNPSGAGKSIPAGFQAHNDCYGCHTAESKIGSCSVCHQLAPYSRTPQSRYAFKSAFSHGQHAAMGCDDCHTINPGAPQGRQVTNIVAQEHNGAANSCAKCHNGTRAFSGNDPLNFAACSRCHKGSGFDMLPGSPF